ncbi:ribonuclease H family protein [Demequina pelophila]|uniref:ribonuclease H family protein n=1 Tax=Demequina pelophila TaxID=1638984 RepID=UPI0009E41D8C|nr:ribonuclease H [Demequina pelophila]
MDVVVATDGACLGNPGPAGWAWVREDGAWRSGALARSTNNVGELLAVLDALREHARVPRLELLVDSQYVINTYTKWMDGHRRRGWKTSSGSPTKNADILQDLIDVRDARKAAGLPPATLTWVRGHDGHVLNEWADDRASAAARVAGARDGEVWGSDEGELLDVDAAPAGARPAQARPGASSRATASSGRTGKATGASSTRKPSRDGFGNQTDLGKVLGATAVEVGRMLEAAGLRDPGTREPTERALADGLAKAAKLRDGTPYYRWHTDRAAAALRGD